MTAAVYHAGQSALTSPWVRTMLMMQTPDVGHTRELTHVATPDHAELADIAAARRGDGEAYGRIIARYQNLLARRMMRFSRDPAVIEELVHDVFVEAYYSLSRYRAEAPLEHWLQRIATRVGYRRWTRERKRPPISLHVVDHDLAERTDESGRDAVDEVGVLLERLPPRDRLVLTLLYLESRTVAEAAKLAGWSQTMVKVQAHRARQKLRKLVQESQSRQFTDA